MNTLSELAKVLRSKNSGPFELTLDILFSDEAPYRRVKESGVLTRENIARRNVQRPMSSSFSTDAALASRSMLGPAPRAQCSPGCMAAARAANLLIP